jgi:hypothetical protein
MSRVRQEIKPHPDSGLQALRHTFRIDLLIRRHSPF